MDAVKFIRDHQRMCKDQSSCKRCPASGNCIKQSFFPRCPSNIRSEVKLVEQWSAEHPLLTRWTKLKKQYPNMDNKAKYSVCARDLGYECEDCADIQCNECWNKPVEEAQE